MQRDIVYRSIAATHIACDTVGMLHGEISHGNFIIFDAFLGLFGCLAHPTVLSYEIYASKMGFGVAFGADYEIFFSIFQGKKFFFGKKKFHLWRT